MEEKKFYLTKEGLEKIKKDYDVLKNLRLSKTKGEVPNIWESEDVSPEYISFQEDMILLDKKINELENILRNVIIIEGNERSREKVVGPGAIVTLDIDGEEDKFTIVGTLEANPSLGKISNESPLGKALTGHRVGDQVIVSSPIKTAYNIKKIEYL